MKQCNDANWLTRTCVASTWLPKAPLDGWKPLPLAQWEELAERVEVRLEEVVVSGQEREVQQEVEGPTQG